MCHPHKAYFRICGAIKNVQSWLGMLWHARWVVEPMGFRPGQDGHGSARDHATFRRAPHTVTVCNLLLKRWGTLAMGPAGRSTECHGLSLHPEI
jgi:hypothetical protein